MQPSAEEMCGETTKAGEPCLLKPGQGTDHTGVGPCVYHGGDVWEPAPGTPLRGSKAKQGRQSGKAYAERMARPSLEMLVGFRVEVDPHEAMLMCINIASAEVTFYTSQIAMLEADEIIGRPKQEMLDKEGRVHDLQQPIALNIWIEARNRGMERLAKFCKMAMDIGLQERQVQAAERYGLAIARMVEGILGEIGLTKEQQLLAPTIVRKHLALASTGAPVPATPSDGAALATSGVAGGRGSIHGVVE